MRTMMPNNLNKLLTSVAACALILLCTSNASALSISAEFNLESSAIANPVFLPSPGDLRVDLTPGDVIALEVFVSNPSADLITAIFASLVYDVAQISFLGGAFNNILTEATCAGLLCSPATMLPLGAVSQKPSDPSSQATSTTGWIQAVSHTNIDGVNGQGPDSAVLLAFQYIGPGGLDFVAITAAETAGDASAGNVGPIVFSGATINVPEPNAALLLGFGLLGLARARSTHNNTTDSRSA